MITPDTPLDIGNGFSIRHATAKDTDALVDMHIHTFANPDTGELDTYLGGWTRDLMGGKHPTFRPEDFLLVVENATNKIVSCMCLISQTWSMEGVSFPVGRVEIVGTDAAYRRRGFVRELFRVLHDISARRGELVQAITGIPFYYRQFGYEYAIEMTAFRTTYVPQNIPTLKEGETEKFRLRHAEMADLPFVAETYKLSAARSLVHGERDVAAIEYEHFHENDPLNPHDSWWDVIETLDGERVGVLLHRRYVYQGMHPIICCEIRPPYEWHEVTPFLLRELPRQAGQMQNDGNKPLESLRWSLASNHPLYAISPGSINQPVNPYAWYIRVADLAAFLTRIAPVLEKRLAESPLRDYTGELRLNFYRDGVQLKFEDGKFIQAQRWRATASDAGQKGFGDAAFPDLTFLKLLFGYRSRAELADMYPDLIVEHDRNRALLDVLFPKRPSHVVPIH